MTNPYLALKEVEAQILASKNQIKNEITQLLRKRLAPHLDCHNRLFVHDIAPTSFRDETIDAIVFDILREKGGYRHGSTVGVVDIAKYYSDGSGIYMFLTDEQLQEAHI